MTNIHLFSRDYEGGVHHHEYLPSEMEEVFTPEQRKALHNGQQVVIGSGINELVWVSATAICTKMLMGESRTSSVTRIRAVERASYVSRYGADSKIVAKFDRRTAELIAAAKRADAVGL